MIQATRSNYRDFGKPAAGLFFGRDTKVPVGPGTAVTITQRGMCVTLHDAAGVVLDSFGISGKFWLAPIAEQHPETVEAAEQRAADLIAERLEGFAGGIALRYATVTLERDHAAQHGDPTLAAALAAMLTELEPAHEQHRAEQQAATAAQRARVAAYRAAGWDGRPLTPAASRELDARIAEQAAAAETPAPAPVVVVPCGATKASGQLAAGEKYIGSYHRQARKAAAAIAERTGARVLILSALHGLIELDHLVDDYDLSMGQPGCVTAGRVAEQAAALGIAEAVVTVIAGKKYARVVTAVWPHAIRVLDGTTGMGDQMHRMAEIARGTWSPAPSPAIGFPALFGAELVATPAAVADPLADSSNVPPKWHTFYLRSLRGVRKVGVAAHHSPSGSSTHGQDHRHHRGPQLRPNRNRPHRPVRHLQRAERRRARRMGAGHRHHHRQDR